MTVEELRAQGLVEEVEPDAEGARVMLANCSAHIASAQAVADTDPEGAFQLAYDAARKAINAHMLARGLFARPAGRAPAPTSPRSIE